MQIQKTKAGYISYFVFLITTVYLVLCTGISAVKLIPEELRWHPVYVSAGVLLILTVLFGLLMRSIGLKKAIAASHRSYKRKENPFFVREILPVLVVYVAAILCRVIYLNQTSLELRGTTAIFENACVGAEIYADSRLYFHGATALYEELLHVFCILFGNDAIAVFCLNAVLQVIMIIGVYLAVRLLYNRTAAIVSALLFNVLPVVYLSLAYVDAVSLLTACMAFWFILLALVQRHAAKHGMKSKAVYLLYIIYGIFSGALCMLDIVGGLCVCSGLVLILVSGQKKQLRSLWYLLGSIFGFCVTAGILAVFSEQGGVKTFSDLFDLKQNPVVSYLTQYFQLYGNRWNLSGWILEFRMSAYELGILVLLTGMNLILYFDAKWNELLWMVFFYPLMLILPIYNLNLIDLNLFVTMILIITAAAGVGTVMHMKNPMEASMNSRKTRIPVTDELLQQETEPLHTEESVRTTDSVKTEEVVKTNDSVKAEEVVKTNDSVKAEESDLVLEKETVKEIHMIENPLPLPKKHERKEMDFAIEVSDDKMHFDLDIPLEEDFDLK